MITTLSWNENSHVIGEGMLSYDSIDPLTVSVLLGWVLAAVSSCLIRKPETGF